MAINPNSIYPKFAINTQNHNQSAYGSPKNAPDFIWRYEWDLYDPDFCPLPFGDDYYYINNSGDDHSKVIKRSTGELVADLSVDGEYGWFVGIEDHNGYLYLETPYDDSYPKFSKWNPDTWTCSAHTTAYDPSSYLSLTNDDAVVFKDYNSGLLVALECSDLSLRWSYNPGTFNQCCAIDDDLLYIGSTSKFVVLNTLDGSVGYGPFSGNYGDYWVNPILLDEDRLFTCKSLQATLIDPTNGSIIWTKDYGGSECSMLGPAYDKDREIIYTWDSSGMGLVAIDATDGSLIWNWFDYMWDGWISPLLLDKDGNLLVKQAQYFWFDGDYDSMYSYIKFSPEGEVLWQVPIQVPSYTYWWSSEAYTKPFLLDEYDRIVTMSPNVGVFCFGDKQPGDTVCTFSTDKGKFGTKNRRVRLYGKHGVGVGDTLTVFPTRGYRRAGIMPKVPTANTPVVVNDSSGFRTQFKAGEPETKSYVVAEGVYNLNMNHQHKLAKQSDGTLWAVYTYNYSFGVSYSSDGGQTWTEDFELGDVTTQPKECSILTDSEDNVHVIWTEYQEVLGDMVYNVRYRVKTSDGWQDPEWLTENPYGRPIWYVSFCCDENDTIHAVYSGYELTGGNSTVRYIYKDSGGSWQWPVVISDGTSSTYCGIIYHPNELFVVWKEGSTYKTRKKVSDSWDTIRTFYSSSYSVAGQPTFTGKFGSMTNPRVVVEAIRLTGDTTTHPCDFYYNTYYNYWRESFECYTAKTSLYGISAATKSNRLFFFYGTEGRILYYAGHGGWYQDEEPSIYYWGPMGVNPMPMDAKYPHWNIPNEGVAYLYLDSNGGNLMFTTTPDYRH